MFLGRSLHLTSWPVVVRAALIVLVYHIGYSTLYLFSRLFVTETGAAIWYPAAALTAVLLLVGGLWYTPAVLSVGLLLHLFVPDGAPLLATVGGSVGISAAYGGAAWLLRQRIRIDPALPRLRDMLWLLAVMAFAAPLLAGLLYSAVLLWTTPLTRADYLQRTLEFWAGDATGVAMVAPLLLLAQEGRARWRHGLHTWRTWRWTTRLEPFVALALLMISVSFAYGVERGERLDFTYLIFVPLMWLAFRLDFAWMTLAVVVLNLVAVSWVKGGLVQSEVVVFQFGLMTLTLMGLLVSAIVTEVRRSQRRLSYAAYHDDLTDLPNRTLLRKRLEALIRLDDGGRPIALLLLDLARFKHVNDSLGHTLGDQLLVAVSYRLSGQLRHEDTLARLGGDKFIVLLSGLSEEGEAVAVAERLLVALTSPFHVQGYELFVSARVGVAVGARGLVQAETLLRDADVALHTAKRKGEHAVLLFDRTMHEHTHGLLRLEADLRRAVERGQLRVFYQPVEPLSGNAEPHMEALLRWEHPEQGWISPGQFIPLAEETGLILPMGWWLLDEVCRQLRQWEGEGRRCAVAINLSARQLYESDFDGRVLGTLAAHGLSPRRLHLELTESIMMGERESAIEPLRRLAHQGVHIAIDDFGTGYSSLSYLRQLPVTHLKIDHSFLRDIPMSADNCAIVQAVVEMGGSLGLCVVAEGVETEAQLRFVRETGCHFAQGFLLGRPAPP